MLALEDSNRVLAAELARLGGGAKLEDTEVAFTDLGNAAMRLRVTAKKSAVRVEMTLPGQAALCAMGLEEHLRTYLGAECSVSVSDKMCAVDCSVENAIRPDVTARLVQLRRAALGLPLYIAMRNQADGKTTPLMTVPINAESGDAMHVQGHADRVTVTMAVSFRDPGDATIGRLFLQEFADVRRQNQAMHNAPSVLVDRAPPRDLVGAIGAASPGATYVTLVLFPAHMAADRAEHTVSMVVSLREYVHYHVKCARAYMHVRMRAKVSEFLQMLNRTKTSASD